MKKGGVSTVVAIVLIVLLSVSAVTVLFSFVIPLVEDNMDKLASEDVNIEALLGTNTVWWSDGNTIQLQLRRGTDARQVDYLLFKLKKSSKVDFDYLTHEVLEERQIRTYGFTVGAMGKPDLIEIYGMVDGELELLDSVSGFDLPQTEEPILGWLPCELGEIDEGVMICDCEGLQAMSNDVSETYTLGRDIDCSDSMFWDNEVDPEICYEQYSESCELVNDAYGTTSYCTGSTYTVCEGFDPIGTEAEPFTGELRGKGHKITGLSINRPNESGVGLFGWLGKANITDVSIEDFNVVGGNNVGMFAGVLNGSSVSNIVSIGGTASVIAPITGMNVGSQCPEGEEYNCSTDFCGCINTDIHAVPAGETIVFKRLNGEIGTGGLFGKATGDKNFVLRDLLVMGDVEGTFHVGGIIGISSINITFDNVTFIGNISGVNSVGGFIGSSYGRNLFINSKFKGNVYGPEKVGGFIGFVKGTNDFVSSSVDAEITGGGVSIGGFVGHIDSVKVAGNPYSPVEFTNSNWTNYSNDIAYNCAGSYVFDDGTSSQDFDTEDQLLTCLALPDPAAPAVPQNCFGDSDSDNIWEICTCRDLQQIGTDDETLSRNYILMNSFSCSSISNFQPIGSPSNPFEGTLDGQGHIISNLYINKPGTHNVGLFGLTDGATIEKVGLEGGQITGGFNVGSLVGTGSGAIKNVYSTSRVKGISTVGGLIGGLSGEDSYVENSYWGWSSLEAENTFGGLVGFVGYGASVTKSFSAIMPHNHVSKSPQSGGLIGSWNHPLQGNYNPSFESNTYFNEYNGPSDCVGSAEPAIDQDQTQGNSYCWVSHEFKSHGGNWPMGYWNKAIWDIQPDYETTGSYSSPPALIPQN